MPVPADSGALRARSTARGAEERSDGVRRTGPPGQRWIVASAERAELLRGPDRAFGPKGAAARRLPGPGRRVLAGGAGAPARWNASASQFRIAGTVAFSADRGVYRVLLGAFPTARPRPRRWRRSCEARVKKRRLRRGGRAGAGRGGRLSDVTVGGRERPTPALARRHLPGRRRTPAFSSTGSPTAAACASRSIRAGTLNVVNRVDLEEYLYGVVPAEMGPKRYDEIEALKAQAVAARTYALAHRGQFEARGLRPLRHGQVPGLFAGSPPRTRCRPPPSTPRAGSCSPPAAVRRRALRLDVRRPHRERRERLLGEAAVPYLVSVECGELATAALAGRRGRAERPARGRGRASSGAATCSRATRAGKRAGRARWARDGAEAGPACRRRRRRRRRSRPRPSIRRSSRRSTWPRPARCT